jgi:hypothetical protein
MSTHLETGPQTTPHAEDLHLWEKYTPLDAEEATYDFLLPSEEIESQERATFIASGYTSLPDLRPREVDATKLQEWENSLLELKQQVPAELSSPHLKNAYRWRINESIANLRVVRSADDGDHRRFEAYNSFIYGSPDTAIFKAVSDWLCRDAEQAQDSERPEIREAATEVLTALSNHRGDKSLLVPDQETFDAVRDDHYREDGFVAITMAGVELPVEGPVDATTGDPALRQMIANLQTGQVIEDARSWSNTPTSLRRPADFEMESAQEFTEYNVHELSHAVENMNGRNSPVMLTASGLDRYERGNEGKAVVREQVVNPTVEAFTDGRRWQELMGRHLAVSLGSGLGGKNMNFAETYAVLNSAARLYEYTHSPESDKEAAAQRADDQAWNLAVSVYGGTNGDGTAGVNHRPMIYLEGNVAIWKLAKESPRAVHQGDLGKFDLSNERHIAILQQAGILPKAE